MLFKNYLLIVTLCSTLLTISWAQTTNATTTNFSALLNTNLLNYHSNNTTSTLSNSSGRLSILNGPANAVGRSQNIILAHPPTASFSIQPAVSSSSSSSTSSTSISTTIITIVSLTIVICIVVLIIAALYVMRRRFDFLRLTSAAAAAAADNSSNNKSLTENDAESQQQQSEDNESSETKAVGEAAAVVADVVAVQQQVNEVNESENLTCVENREAIASLTNALNNNQQNKETTAAQEETNVRAAVLVESSELQQAEIENQTTAAAAAQNVPTIMNEQTSSTSLIANVLNELSESVVAKLATKSPKKSDDPEKEPLNAEQ